MKLIELIESFDEDTLNGANPVARLRGLITGYLSSYTRAVGMLRRATEVTPTELVGIIQLHGDAVEAWASLERLSEEFEEAYLAQISKDELRALSFADRARLLLKIRYWVDLDLVSAPMDGNRVYVARVLAAASRMMSGDDGRWVEIMARLFPMEA